LGYNRKGEGEGGDIRIVKKEGDVSIPLKRLEFEVILRYFNSYKS